MQYVRLGGTGLKVSRVCLGMMSYGDPLGGRGCWTRRRPARSSGGRPRPGSPSSTRPTCTPTGVSEEVTGNLLRRVFDRREDYVLATKVHAPMGRAQRQRPVPQAHPRRHRRLPAPPRRRLRGPLPDPPLRPETPIEETMEALHDVVRAGKARYIGASSMFAWQFAKAQYAARATGSSPCRTTTTSSTARRSAR